MTYDYIGLCNETLVAVGEEPFADATEFNAAVGLQSHVKYVINSAIRDIYSQEQNEWVFAKTTDTITLVAGTLEYSTNSNAASIDWDTFFIQYDAALDSPDHQELHLVSYDTYVKYYRSSEENSLTATEYTKPHSVVRSQDNKAIFFPKADAAYTVEYEYFAKPTDLSASTDVPTIPENYRAVIISGATMYMHKYLDDETKAQLEAGVFRKKIKDMRMAIQPYEDTVRVGSW